MNVNPVGSSASLQPATSQSDSAASEFLKYVKMSPIERIRYDYLKSQGLDEKSLSALPREQREAVEAKIKELIEQKLGLDMDQPLSSGTVASSR